MCFVVVGLFSPNSWKAREDELRKIYSEKQLQDRQSNSPVILICNVQNTKEKGLKECTQCLCHRLFLRYFGNKIELFILSCMFSD